MAISHQKVPKDGWKFFQDKSNTTIVSKDWNSLIIAVKAHRKSNGIDEGNVEVDVDEQIEKNHPVLSI